MRVADEGLEGGTAVDLVEVESDGTRDERHVEDLEEAQQEFHHLGLSLFEGERKRELTNIEDKTE